MMFHPELNQIAVMFKLGLDDTRDGIYINLKTVHRAFIVVIVEQGADGTQHTFSLKQATAGAGTATGTSEKALLVAGQAWANQDCFTGATESNILAAVTPTLGAYQLDANVSRTKLLIFDVLPERDMDIANGFCCIGIDSTDLSAANGAVALAILIPSRYAPLGNVFAD
jgi:hypothetical protein